MKLRCFRWSQDLQEDDPNLVVWDLKIDLIGYDAWDLRSGHMIEHWDPDTSAYYENETAVRTDFPSTSFMLPVYSPRLRILVDQKGIDGIQYLPLKVRHRATGRHVYGYHLVNYLHVVDCLDRGRSVFQTWTKDNLLFWEERIWMLGAFRDVSRVVLDSGKLGNVQVFRLWGWEEMVVVREDLKLAIEEAGITGCRFTELEIS
jgi:hypothetical protein